MKRRDWLELGEAVVGLFFILSIMGMLSILIWVLGQG